jgi:hypothetical protein
LEKTVATEKQQKTRYQGRENEKSKMAGKIHILQGNISHIIISLL